MIAEGYCEECKGNKKVHQIYFAGFNCTVYFACGHHVHYVFAFKSTPAHHDSEGAAFEKSTEPIALIPHPPSYPP